MSAFSNYLQELNRFVSNEGDKQSLLSSIAALREAEYQTQESPLTSFYKKTYEDYEKRAMEAQKELSMFENIWQARYQRADTARQELEGKRLRAGYTTINAYEDWYAGDKGKNKNISLMQLGSSEGSLKERLERIVSRRGKRNKFTEEAEKTLMLQMDYDEFTSSSQKYKSQYESELASSTKAAEEARKKFYEDKQRMLDLAKKAGGYDYRGATYVEKPL